MKVKIGHAFLTLIQRMLVFKPLFHDVVAMVDLLVTVTSINLKIEAI